MELKNEIRVDLPLERAWATLTDVEFIAPCMPGAQLTEIDGDEFKGGVKVKVGPITAQYKGTARFLERDEANRRVVLEATGRDSRGAGNATAEITAQMSPDGAGTLVAITTDLKVTGKVAQFGRGVMADVTEKLIGQFTESLQQKLNEVGDATAGGGGGAAAGGGVPTSAGAAAAASNGADASGPRKIDMAEPEPVDLLDTAGRPLIKRILAPLLVVAFFLMRRRRRRRKRRQG